ncbi:50S ribosomal protein L13 [[Eubacterium] cellulosolvens]
MIIDASNLVLGRILSYVAKQAIEGQEVIILNISKAVISGNKKNIIAERKVKLRTRTLASQDKGPTHPRRPETYAKRALRGMLPYKTPKGKNAYKRVKIYADIPEEYSDKQYQKISMADASKLKCNYMLLEELSKEIGGI